MKKANYKKYLLSLIITIAVTTAFAGTNPPDPGGDPAGSDPLGGGAPIGSGTIILISLGAAYAGKKIYYIGNEKTEKN